MAQLEQLWSRCSIRERVIPARSDFHVYLWPYDGVANLQPSNGAAGLALMDYYSALGMNFTRDHYDISGSGSYTQAGINAGVDFWGARAEASRIDLWWLDTETTFYTGTAADAALDLTGAQNGVSWSQSRWAVGHTTPMYVGNYGNNTGIRVQGIIGYPWSMTPLQLATLQNDNTVSGVAVANTWAFMGNELYQSKIDEFTAGMDLLCQEKRRMGVSTPLIPFIWRTLTTSYSKMYASLAYAYAQPECNGLILWGTTTASAAPTYYDNQDWMRATLDFMKAYNIVRGNPF